MTRDSIKAILERTARGELSVPAALGELEGMPVRDLGFARVDTHRELRNGIPEVIYSEGKTAEQVIEIARTLIASGQGVLATRLDADKAARLADAVAGFRYNAIARIACHGSLAARAHKAARVAVVSAGTGDQAVAEEASETLAFLGIEPIRFNDVGVAGLHRVLAVRDELAAASVVIVIAGMEGALPSVVGGLIACPVIAVPTSIGYGASFGGLAALLAMLSSCAAGITVVNIDNGFGAAVAASAIVRACERAAATES